MYFSPKRAWWREEAPGSLGSKSATALFCGVQIGLPRAQWMAAPMKSLVWADVPSKACGEVAPKTFFTSKGARSRTMLAVEKAPTSQPARAKVTHGAATFWPEGVVSAKELSAVAGLISDTRSVQ